MTKRQEELKNLIEYQRRMVERFPGDTVEAVALDTLYTSLRDTFQMIDGGAEAAPQYEWSPSRAVLKRVI